MPALASILCGYAALVALAGWAGIVAIAVHLTIMCAATRRKARNG